MSAIRQKRKSCEACRARKLKCSGKDTGCSRCVHLGLACRFHEKGMPGRPRKWSPTQSNQSSQTSSSHSSRQPHLPSRQQQHQHEIGAVTRPGLSGREFPETPSVDSLFFGEASSSGPTAHITGSTAGDVLTTEAQGWTPQEGDLTFSGNEVGASLPFLDFDTSGQLDSLSLDPFQACLSHHHPGNSPTAPHSTSSPRIPQSCDCARQVFETMRLLNYGTLSHGTLAILRRGTSLFETLLTCPICYDVSKPPRVTLQNVLLIGRLTIEVSTCYQSYLKSLKDHGSDPATGGATETVYLSSDGAIVEINVDRGKMYDLVKDSLKEDAARLVGLAEQFEARQKNRHLIGHGACPDKDGRCWKEKEDIDPDPSDICPQNPAARALIPCYRVVDEAKARIQMFEDALAQHVANIAV